MDIEFYSNIEFLFLNRIRFQNWIGFRDRVRYLYRIPFLYFLSMSNLLRHFSYVTKSCIFKNLNLRKKADRNFCSTFLKIRFRHLKLYSNRPSWLARSCCHSAPFERQKIEVHIFEGANLAGFGTWKFSTKRDLNRQKQVFIHNYRPWPAQKPKIWSIFYGKKFI